MSAQLTHNQAGNYRFLGNPRRPFSSGAVADPGFDVVHAMFERPVPLAAGIAAAARHVSSAGRPVQALAGFELRIQKAFSQQEFDEFNVGYVSLLRGIGLEVDGSMPAGRTNVAPTVGGVTEPSVFGFSFTAPASRGRPAFLLSGVPEEVQGGAAERLTNIAQILATRAAELGCRLGDATDIQLYADQAVGPAALAGVAREFGEAMLHGLKWFPSQPPIEGLIFEIDARSSGSHVVISGPQ